MSSYAIEQNGQAFTPAGREPIADVETHNQKLEREQLEALKAHPEHVFLYVKVTTEGYDNDPSVRAAFRKSLIHCAVTTWMGTVLDPHAWLGERKEIYGFGFGGYKRALSCQIFGVLYHGWYYESSGDYCRLKRAKRQG